MPSGGYQDNMKATVLQSQIRGLETEFVRKVNRDIATKITPIYNTFLLVCAAFFAYFIVMNENQCFAKAKEAFGVQYEDTDDVTKQFYLINNAGLVLLLVSVLMYYLQGKEDMFDLMRPYVIITNLLTLGWFITLQFFRFKDTGRACSGDFLPKDKLPANFSTVYLGNEGTFLMYYVIGHYTVYILQKIICILITNKHEAEYEKKKSLIQNKV